MEAVKTTRQFEGSVLDGGACFPGLTGRAITGYEIHMGKTVPVCEEGEELSAFTPAGTGVRCGNVYGTYVHGFFDEAGVAGSVIRGLAKSKGVAADTTGEMSRREFKEKEYDRLADVLEENMDMKAIYAMLREARISEDD